MACAVRRLAVPTLFATFVLAGASGRAHAAQAYAGASAKAPESYHVIYLKGVTTQDDAIDILTDLRNLFVRHRVEIFYVSSQNAISMMSTEQEYETARQVVAGMERGPRVFRLTYSISGTDAAGKAMHRNVGMTVASGNESSIVQGQKIPVTTGGFSSKNGSEVQYLDAGLKLTAKLSGPADDLVLRTRLGESAVVSEKSILGVEDPVLRQTALDTISIVTVGKPLVLGSISVPGTSRQDRVEVTVEPVQ